MDNNTENLIERLAQLPLEERKRILNAFLESAIAVNQQEKVADEATDSATEKVVATEARESAAKKVETVATEETGAAPLEEGMLLYPLVDLAEEEEQAKDNTEAEASSVEAQEAAEVEPKDDADAEENSVEAEEDTELEESLAEDEGGEEAEDFDEAEQDEVAEEVEDSDEVEEDSVDDENDTDNEGSAADEEGTEAEAEETVHVHDDSDEEELLSMMVAGSGMAAGLLGVALNSRALKSLGAAGTILGGLMLLDKKLR